jgi:L-ascorbate metabolism protein UlaG (beta-lactamase superfamily)
MNLFTSDQPGIDLFDCKHEPNEPLGRTPVNIGVHYLGRLTNGGDSHHFATSKDILALPITAPWGTLTRAVALAAELEPKFVLPVHDWHWNVAARQQTYDRCEVFFAGIGIKFIKLVDGQAVEL